MRIIVIEIIGAASLSTQLYVSSAERVNDPQRVIGSILRYDAKVNTYKMALLRAINDLAMGFPDVGCGKESVAVPLRMIAERWIAYYWPFVSVDKPILQGPRAKGTGGLKNDVSFRSALSALRSASVSAGYGDVSWGGFLLASDMNSASRRRGLLALRATYERAVSAAEKALRQPIRYAGKGDDKVFRAPAALKDLGDVAALPGTTQEATCLLIPHSLWRAFVEFSMWVEALCVQEWALFLANVAQEDGTSIDRGEAFRMLTDKPEGRQPLTFERNAINVLLGEGYAFTCPWTEKRIEKPQLGDKASYDVDHVVPVSVYPINQLWNLVPADPFFNSHVKRDRVPDLPRLERARPHLTLAYGNYLVHPPLREIIRADAEARFAGIPADPALLPDSLAAATVSFVNQMAEYRSLARFS